MAGGLHVVLLVVGHSPWEDPAVTETAKLDFYLDTLYSHHRVRERERERERER